MPRAPGTIRDSIVDYLSNVERDASTREIETAVETRLGKVSRSSVRSYLNLNAPATFERTGRGRYRLAADVLSKKTGVVVSEPAIVFRETKLFHADCLSWLSQQEPLSVHAVVTDPPYGLVEYSEREQTKLRNGRGGVWRIPPAFDGHKRSPLPRFTVLGEAERAKLDGFFKELGSLLRKVTVPGGNVIVASNPLLLHIVAHALSKAGLEPRGTIIRLTMTMRGGDRPKNAHQEFDGVSVMPRSMWEPWAVFRAPLDGRVQDNLRRWKTGGFQRPSSDRPFGDVIKSGPASQRERKIAPHPSLKPQSFLRRVVRASLPLGEGIVLDPFAGSGSTLAAAQAVGYGSIGVECDARYVAMAATAIPELSSLHLVDPV